MFGEPIKDMTAEQIESLLPWSKPREIPTKYGPRILRKAKPTDEFWTLWRNPTAQAAFKSMDIKVAPWQGQWEVTWWRKIDEHIIAQRQANEQASYAASADIAIPAPDGCEYMPFQKAGIKFALDVRNCLIADEMGLGKSVESIGYINASPDIKKVLVVTKAKLKLNWERELRKWLVRPMSVGIVEPTSWPDTAVVIVNYDIAHRFAVQLREPWDLVILDEVQACKNDRSRRAQAIFGRPANKKTGEPARPGVNARLRLALTGTPIENRPIEIQPVLAWLQPEQERWKKWGFAKRYCAAHNNGFGYDFSGASNLDELRKYLRQLVMVRRQKSEVLKELPAKTRQVIELEVDDATSACVDREERFLRENEEAIHEAQATLELAKAGSDEEFKAAVESLRTRFKVAFTEMARLRHDTAVAKIPAVIDWIKDELEETKKVLCFVHHHDVGDAIHAAFPNSILVTGETDKEAAQAAVDRFQTDPDLPLFIGSIRATGEGITLTAANLVLFAELDWVPGKMCQCEDRAHRIGQRDNVLAKYLVVRGSLDAKMMTTLLEKMIINEQALDKGIEIEEVEEPILPVHYDGGRKQAYRDEAAGITDAQIELIHAGLMTLAGMCDGASKRDAHGFNKIDASIGHSLAHQARLTPTQAALGRRILRKYSRQLGQELIERIV